MIGDPLVRFQRVGAGYGGPTRVLDDVDFTLAEGEFVGIVGPSGSGKTSLLRVLTGALAPSSGSVWRRPRLRLGYVPQVETVDWDFPITVGECVLMARSSPGRRVLPWASPGERLAIGAVLERLAIGELERRHIRDLSGGQQQRVFVARALYAEPDLLLLDEPTSGVDVATRHEMLHLLGDLHREGLSIALTTHDLNGVAAHLPRLVCLHTSVIADGSPREVLRADVLEATYGARMDVLLHAGMPVVVDHVHEHEHRPSAPVPADRPSTEPATLPVVDPSTEPATRGERGRAR